MKRLNAIIATILAALTLCGCSQTVKNETEEQPLSEQAISDIKLIKSVIRATNNSDVKGYIALFTKQIREEMTDFIERNPETTEFFASDSRQLLSIALVAPNFAKENDWLFTDVFDSYKEFDCYYVTENVHFKEEDGDIKKNGEQANIYVIVPEGNGRCLYRISAVGHDLIESYLTPIDKDTFDAIE